jgi:hypothetical protein
MSIRKMRFYACVPTKKDFICPKTKHKEKSFKINRDTFDAFGHVCAVAFSFPRLLVPRFRGSRIVG